MKSARRFLPSVLACLAAASLLCRIPVMRAADPTPTPTLAPVPTADDTARKAAAEEVLKAMHMEAIFDSTTERMTTQLDRISDGAARQLGNKPEVAEFQKRMRTETRDTLKKQFNWETLEPTFAQAYADIYTTQELKDLAVFYSSPLGQKLTAKQPEISERLGKASQERAQQVLPLIVQKVRAESAKLQAAMATPSPSPESSPEPASSPAAVAPAAKGTPPAP